MRAMVLQEVGKPLVLEERALPTLEADQVLLRVHTCGVCRTDLHIIDGELPPPKLPLILGHQIVGSIEKKGSAVANYELDQRVGVPWLQKSCGHCTYCKAGQENLCDHPLFTGYHVDGGFAEYCAVSVSALYPLPDFYDDIHIAPLLCAGFIGYRSYRMASGAKRFGFYGFGSSAHILTQIVVAQGGEVYAFTRDGDQEKQAFAKSLGAIWAGDSSKRPPVPLDAALIFAPSGELIIEALKSIKKGGSVICSGIHMSPIPSFPYRLLWEERKIGSVSNLTHQDGHELLQLATKIPLHTQVTSYPLEQANEALAELRAGKNPGSLVLRI